MGSTFLKAKEIIGTVSEYYGYAKLVYDWYMWASGASGQAARDLRQRAQQPALPDCALEDKIRQTDAYVDRAIVDAKITRDRRAPRRREDRPRLPFMEEYRRAAELLAASAANTLIDEHFYNMPTKATARASTPAGDVSFVDGGDRWIALRAANGKPIDGELRDTSSGTRIIWSRSPAGPGLRGLRPTAVRWSRPEICPPTFISDPFEPSRLAPRI